MFYVGFSATPEVPCASLGGHEVADQTLLGASVVRTFVGIGFGPIQSGLFLLEAHRSGNFDRLVVAEIVPEIVDAVRWAFYRVPLFIPLKSPDVFGYFFSVQSVIL